MIYYIEIKDPNTDKTILGELESEEQIDSETFIQAVRDFAESNGICPDYAVENCLAAIKE